MTRSSTRLTEQRVAENLEAEKVVSNDISSLRSMVICKVCFKYLYEPYTLGCGHTFCYSCLCSWFETNRTKKTCPKCRSSVQHQPAPSYLIKEIVTIFITRAQLIPADETLEEHRTLREEEAAQVERDKANTDRKTGGLFRGCFSKKTQTQPLTAVQDLDDGVTRCPMCHWELESGVCYRCELRFGEDGQMSGIYGDDSHDEGTDLDEYIGFSSQEELDGDLALEDADAELGFGAFEGAELPIPYPAYFFSMPRPVGVFHDVPLYPDFYQDLPEWPYSGPFGEDILNGLSGASNDYYGEGFGAGADLAEGDDDEVDDDDMDGEIPHSSHLDDGDDEDDDDEMGSLRDFITDEADEDDDDGDDDDDDGHESRHIRWDDDASSTVSPPRTAPTPQHMDSRLPNRRVRLASSDDSDESDEGGPVTAGPRRRRPRISSPTSDHSDVSIGQLQYESSENESHASVPSTQSPSSSPARRSSPDAEDGEQEDENESDSSDQRLTVLSQRRRKRLRVSSSSSEDESTSDPYMHTQVDGAGPMTRRHQAHQRRPLTSLATTWGEGNGNDDESGDHQCIDMIAAFASRDSDDDVSRQPSARASRGLDRHGQRFGNPIDVGTMVGSSARTGDWQQTRAPPSGHRHVRPRHPLDPQQSAYMALRQPYATTLRSPQTSRRAGVGQSAGQSTPVALSSSVSTTLSSPRQRRGASSRSYATAQPLLASTMTTTTTTTTTAAFGVFGGAYNNNNGPSFPPMDRFVGVGVPTYNFPEFL